MKHQVSIERPAAREIDAAYRWIARRAPLTAERWYCRLIDKLHALSRSPRLRGRP